jgi:hypothetical protein
MKKPAPKIYRTTNWPSYNRALKIDETSLFGLIQRLTGMLSHKLSMDEIKPIPTQQFNAV